MSLSKLLKDFLRPKLQSAQTKLSTADAMVVMHDLEKVVRTEIALARASNPGQDYAIRFNALPGETHAVRLTTLTAGDYGPVFRWINESGVRRFQYTVVGLDPDTFKPMAVFKFQDPDVAFAFKLRWA